MPTIDTSSFFWRYLSEGQRGLITVGLHLIEDTKTHPNTAVLDYSYLVFPFAKAYEGFLKQVFLDLGFINEHEYYSTHFRIGRVLNPHLEHSLRHTSMYDKIARHCGGRELADEMWDTWKHGRNLVFHYFPHNLRGLTMDEAEKIIENMMRVMEKTITECKMKKP